MSSRIPRDWERSHSCESIMGPSTATSTASQQGVDGTLNRNNKVFSTGTRRIGYLIVVQVLVSWWLITAAGRSGTLKGCIRNKIKDEQVSSMSCDDLVPDHGYVHFTMSMPSKQARTRNAMSLCAVESAVQHSQPGEKVVLWTLDDKVRSAVEESTKPFEDRGVLVCDATFDQLSKDTPFEGWECTGKYCPNNLSNALRLALLYKYGGVYLDLDIISIRDSSTRVGNLAITQWQNMTWNNGAYMNFRSGHKLLWLLMSRFVQDFDGDRYGHNGPRFLDRVVVPCLQSGAYECKDLSLVAESVYAPIHWKDTTEWLNSTQGMFGSEQDSLLARGTWGIHWYASQWFNIFSESQGVPPCLRCQSMGHILFKDNCPQIFKDIADELMCSHCD